MNKKLISLLLIATLIVLSLPAPARATTNTPGDILITEICTDPQQDWSTTNFDGTPTAPGLGSITTSDEYIELYNASDHIIDLTGWHLVMTDSTTDDDTITADLVKNEQPAGDITQIAPGTYLTLGNPLGSLNNDVRIELYDGPKTSAQLIDSVTLGNFDDGNSADNAPNGDATSLDNEVVARQPVPTQDTNIDSTDFFKTHATMGAINPQPNHPPTIVTESILTGTTHEQIEFDATASTDEDGDNLTYTWDFDESNGIQSDAQGATTSHEFTDAKTYIVTLQVTDARGASSTQKITITITARTYPTSIQLNELFFPAQTSTQSQQNGFIELRNTDTQSTDISDWIIRNQDEAKEYTMPTNTTVNASQLLAIPTSALGFSANELDEIVLLNPNRNTVSRVIIGTEGKEGESYNVSSEGWAWSTTPTPGSANIINRPSEETSDWPSSSQPQSETTDSARVISISQAKELPKNSTAIVRGIVSILPGLLSDSNFYIQDSHAGIKIAMSKKQFPKLSVGDIVEIDGKITHTSQEIYLNISAIDAITIKSHESTPLQPQILNIAQLTDTKKGLLIRTQGAFTKQTSAYITIAQEKTTVRIKKSLLAISKKPSPNELVGITGILTKDAQGFIIMPRAPQDIAFAKQKTSATTAATTKATPTKQTTLVKSGVDYTQLIVELFNAARAYLWHK